MFDPIRRGNQEQNLNAGFCFKLPCWFYVQLVSQGCQWLLLWCTRAQLDTYDTIREHSWAASFMLVLSVYTLCMSHKPVRKGLPPPPPTKENPWKNRKNMPKRPIFGIWSKMNKAFENKILKMDFLCVFLFCYLICQATLILRSVPVKKNPCTCLWCSAFFSLRSLRKVPWKLKILNTLWCYCCFYLL